MDTVIKVDNLFKEYRLGNFGYGTFSEDIQSWWAKINGRPDPNSIIKLNSNQDEDKKHILALNDITFEVKQGDRVGIIGKNGAGKTTLLKILSRISSPSKGSVKIQGKIASLLAVGAGFHPELTGRENIYLNGAILGLQKNQIEDRLDAIVEFSGIEKFIDTPVKRYSSGMHVRLGFAVAAHLNPDILIVDEVLAVGDHEFQKKCLEKMEDESDKGRTILFVSHNMHAVRKLCRTAILLDHGRKVESGPVDQVIESYLKGINPEKPIINFPINENNNGAHPKRLIIKDEKGKLSTNIFIKDVWTIRLEFEVFQKLPHVIVAVGLITNTEIPIITYWSQPSDLNPGNYFSEYVVDKKLSACDLTFVIGITSRETTVFYQENIGQLKILEIARLNQPYQVSGSGFLLSQTRPKINKL